MCLYIEEFTKIKDVYITNILNHKEVVKWEH